MWVVSFGDGVWIFVLGFFGMLVLGFFFFVCFLGGWFFFILHLTLKRHEYVFSCVEKQVKVGPYCHLILYLRWTFEP